MYKIKLPNFEGPFDLLLYFIKRDELNIYDIPIVKITKEFLNYIRLIQMFDLELAGEFLVMAANLMYIKTQMLLPKKVKENGSDNEDPRTPLVQRLLEYKQIKDVSKDLADMAESQKYIYYRELFDADNKLVKENEMYANANIFDLMSAFNKLLNKINFDPKSHVVSIEPVTIEEKIELIMASLNLNTRLRFTEIVRGRPRIDIIVTFLALLELIKNRQIFVFQEQCYDDITISLMPNLN